MTWCKAPLIEEGGESSMSERQSYVRHVRKGCIAVEPWREHGIHAFLMTESSY